MKKHLLPIFLLLPFCAQVKAQCSGGEPFAAISAPTHANIVTITNCNWAGDYNTITSFIAGKLYTFKASSDSFITIRQGSSTGPLVGYGTATVTITSPISGTLYMLVNSSSSCGTGAACITTTIQNVTTLPVSFGKFTASPQHRWTKLDWNTFSETNNHAFLIYRSTDGENYTQIAQQASKGNGANSYTAFDYSPANGTNYYRIKQKDIDGTVVMLADDVASFSFHEKIEIWPNPVDKFMKLRFTAGEYQSLRLTDLNGKELLKQSLSKTQRETKIDMGGRPKGIYVVELKGSNGTQIVKVLK